MRTTIRMNTELARQAKAAAGRSGQSFTQFVERAVAELLARQRRPLQRRRRFRVRTYGGDGVVDGLTIEQAIERAQFEEDLVTVGLKRP